jgi:preprotein translocase subunit YajC
MKGDKLIGTITIAAVLLIIIYIAFSMWRKESRARDFLLVQFPEMGSLQNEDIVTIRGLAVGHVASITRHKGKALVEIDLDEPRIFRTDTKFKNISPNIMGSRNIAIEPGISGELAAIDHIFDGEFEPGFAEILALSDFAKEQVALLMEFVRLLHVGDEENPSFQKKLEDIVDECENLIVTLSDLVSSIEKQTISALNKAGYYSEQMTDAGIKIGKTLADVRVQAKDGIESAGKMVSKINESIEELGKILTEFENSPITMALLDKKEIINDIDSLRSVLQAFVNSIDNQGVKLYDENGKRKSMISLRNIHLFRETARSKAKKRAMQESK